AGRGHVHGLRHAARGGAAGRGGAGAAAARDRPRDRARRRVGDRFAGRAGMSGATTPSVLVVDDSLTVRMDLTEALQAGGLKAGACASLGEARDALATGSIAMAILDVLLPDGDGLELLQEIRATPATASMPVLMLSTEADVRDRIRGLRTG